MNLSAFKAHTNGFSSGKRLALRMQWWIYEGPELRSWHWNGRRRKKWTG